jgi:gamma-glutamyltranspeptidase
MNKQITLIVLYIIFSTLAPAASSKPVFSEKGMVVSTSRQASEAGIEILKKAGMP